MDEWWRPTLVCEVRCTTRCEAVLKDFSQREHLNGLDPVWTLS
jgi:hypothetical protein